MRCDATFFPLYFPLNSSRLFPLRAHTHSLSHSISFSHSHSLSSLFSYPPLSLLSFLDQTVTDSDSLSADVNGVRDCSYYTVVDGDGVDTPTLDHPMAPTATPTGTVAVLQPYDPAFFTGDWAETISERRRRQSTGDRELQLDHQPT